VAIPAIPKRFETDYYGAIEAALVVAYRIPKTALGAFRGRLGALQKGGLLGAQNMPGKGRTLTYRPDSLHRLVFACELLEFGIAPSMILSIVEARWEDQLHEIFTHAEDAVPHEARPDDDVILHIRARLMVDGWSDEVPDVGECRVHELPKKIQEWMSQRPSHPLPARAVVSNLSAALRRFHTAYAKTYLADETARARSAAKGRRKK
jgi:hypothetical protein